MPKFLFAKKYRHLKVNAKILYMLLYSRLLDILEKAEKDDGISFRDRGGVYIIVNVDQLAEVFGFAFGTIYDFLAALEISGLIEKKIIGDRNVKIYFNL